MYISECILGSDLQNNDTKISSPLIVKFSLIRELQKESTIGQFFCKSEATNCLITIIISRGSITLQYPHMYRWFHKNVFFSVQYFNEHCLSIPVYISSWKNHFKETHGTKPLTETWLKMNCFNSKMMIARVWCVMMGPARPPSQGILNQKKCAQKYVLFS